ncbi:uncharacterized protein B0I36DRAFT_432802 [Microdochium trichocladiopsis]|uniref:Secreted protein n=1 Tax=Microdochium trichocladiopsis TaxID=1682393 RepID=A0A9P8Y4S0_9PEZI|nr:uncharacterized protein B0I36DRAFT_432802 [Microdochium trichocladiopsis]KAH7027561.1 hypothetical protein B0I36DRAFT_432802 [Microdochium trichocladiopsis]
MAPWRAPRAVAIICWRWHVAMVSVAGARTAVLEGCCESSVTGWRHARECHRRSACARWASSQGFPFWISYGGVVPVQGAGNSWDTDTLCLALSARVPERSNSQSPSGPSCRWLQDQPASAPPPTCDSRDVVRAREAQDSLSPLALSDCRCLCRPQEKLCRNRPGPARNLFASPDQVA